MKAYKCCNAEHILIIFTMLVVWLNTVEFSTQKWRNVVGRKYIRILATNVLTLALSKSTRALFELKPILKMIGGLPCPLFLTATPLGFAAKKPYEQGRSQTKAFGGWGEANFKMEKPFQK